MAHSSEALPRFDGANAWAMLSAEDQAAIGAIALEYVLSMHGEDAYYDDPSGLGRPFNAAATLLTDGLLAAVGKAIGDGLPALADDALPIPIPSLLGQVCRVCRCSDEDACDGGCGWAEPDLCTACAVSAAQPRSAGASG